MPSREAGAGTRHARPGQNGLAREQVSEIQRARMLAAMYEAVCERGAASVTVAHVVGRSGVSRRTFYEIFSDCQDCFIAAFDEAVDRMAAPVLSAHHAHESWLDRMRASLLALLEFLDEEPLVGRLAIVEALGAGPQVLERRQLVLERVIAAVDAGRTQAKPSTAPPLTAEGAVGAVLSVIHSRLLEEEHPPLAGLAGQLMSMIVLPYLGPAAARRELERPIPCASAKATRRRSDPLIELDMRLTYRTVRVLLAVAHTPGASNRRLADAAGVSDQGQISKLLARLTTLGLVENAGPGLVRGEPNAWRLTARGREVADALNAGASRA